MPKVRCWLCSGTAVATLVRAGMHPVSNRFLRAGSDATPRFNLALAQCAECGLVQLEHPVPVPAVVPQYEWITYNEPEGHLDAVAQLIRQLPGLSDASVTGGISYKDDSTLARLARFGLPQAWRLDTHGDLGAEGYAGLETIQDSLDVARAADVARRRARVDVLVVRHILEHVYAPIGFSAALRELVRPDGYLVFEVPDCTPTLEGPDYTTIWEEHVAYFTPATFRGALARLGFEVVTMESYPYPYENSLVAITRPLGGVLGETTDMQHELARAERFAAEFAGQRTVVRNFIGALRLQGRRIAVFGAGHLACMFINLMDVANDIEFVVDDHPGKWGLLMPGSHLPIRHSQDLMSEGIDICLSSLSPESEEKVIAKQGPFLERGGQLLSLFPSSRRWLMAAVSAGQ